MATCAGCSTAIRARCEATLSERTGMSFNFAGDRSWISRHQFVLAAIHDQVEVFQYDCANQRIRPVGLDDGVEHTAAAEELDEGIIRHVAFLGTSIAIMNYRLTGHDPWESLTSESGVAVRTPIRARWPVRRRPPGGSVRSRARCELPPAGSIASTPPGSGDRTRSPSFPTVAERACCGTWPVTRPCLAQSHNRDRWG